jgi:hypothetical protein
MSKPNEVFMAYPPSSGRLAIRNGYAIRNIGFLPLFEKGTAENPWTLIGVCFKRHSMKAASGAKP